MPQKTKRGGDQGAINQGAANTQTTNAFNGESRQPSTAPSMRQASVNLAYTPPTMSTMPETGVYPKEVKPNAGYKQPLQQNDDFNDPQQQSYQQNDDFNDPQQPYQQNDDFNEPQQQQTYQQNDDYNEPQQQQTYQPNTEFNEPQQQQSYQPKTDFKEPQQQQFQANTAFGASENMGQNNAGVGSLSLIAPVTRPAAEGAVNAISNAPQNDALSTSLANNPPKEEEKQSFFSRLMANPSPSPPPVKPEEEKQGFFSRLMSKSPDANPVDDDDEHPADFLSAFSKRNLAASSDVSNRDDSEKKMSDDSFLDSLRRFKEDESKPSPTLDTNEFLKNPEDPNVPLKQTGYWAMIAGFFSWKLMLFVLFVGLFLYYIYPVITTVKGLISSANELISATSDMTEEPEEKKPVKKTTTEKKKVTKPAPPPEPDQTTSIMQGGSQSGFCLAGEWNGVRSCVAVERGQECVSGQRFDSNEQCVNPEMRY